VNLRNSVIKSGIL